MFPSNNLLKEYIESLENISIYGHRVQIIRG